MSKLESKKSEQKSGRREQHSGHGSITKAGKVRSQTPKIPKSNLKKRDGPLFKNRKRYIKFIANSKKPKTTDRY